MKVALFTDSDVFAGTERHILELAQVLREAGCSASVLCPNDGVLAQKARDAGEAVFPIEKRGAADVIAIATLRTALRERKFDIVHTHNGRTSLIAAIAILAAGRGILVATQHFLSPAHTSLGGIKAGIHRAAHRWVAARSSKIIAISEAVRDSIIGRRAAPPQKIRVILNGVSDPRQGRLKPPASVRAEFGISAEAPLIVVCARLDGEKGLGTLIEAMPAVLARCPGACCLVAGEGSARDTLQEQLDRRGLVEAVRLIGFRPDIFSVIAASDVFVLPSPNEPFGLALIEAMALSRPAIASRAGGPREIIWDGKSGLLFNPGDAADLASKIVEVFSRPAFAAGLAGQARKAYAERFTSRRMGEEIVALYQEVMD